MIGGFSDHARGDPLRRCWKTRAASCNCTYDCGITDIEVEVRPMSFPPGGQCGYEGRRDVEDHGLIAAVLAVAIIEASLIAAAMRPDTFRVRRSIAPSRRRRRKIFAFINGYRLWTRGPTAGRSGDNARFIRHFGAARVEQQQEDQARHGEHRAKQPQQAGADVTACLEGK